MSVRDLPFVITLHRPVFSKFGNFKRKNLDTLRSRLTSTIVAESSDFSPHFIDRYILKPTDSTSCTSHAEEEVTVSSQHATNIHVINLAGEMQGIS